MVGRGVTRQEWVLTGALRSAHSYRSSPEAFRPWGNTLQTPRAGPSRSCPALCVCPCPLHLAGLGSPPLLLLRLLQACPGAATLCLVLLSFCAEFPLALGLQRRPECCPPWVPAGPVGPLLSVSLEPAGVAAVAFALRVGQFLPHCYLPATPDALRSWPREGGVPPLLAAGVSSRSPGTCVCGERSGEQGQAEQLPPPAAAVDGPRAPGQQNEVALGRLRAKGVLLEEQCLGHSRAPGRGGPMPAGSPTGGLGPSLE